MPDADQGETQDDLKLIRAAAREAGQIALGYFKQSPEVWMKGGTSPVSEADYAVDKYLRDVLTAARPDYGWLSEETVDSEARLSARRTFVVDPIDGTRAFLDHQSTWCVSVAVIEHGVSLCGVLDCPAKGIVFHAATGQGAWRQERRIAVRTASNPLAIGGPKAVLGLLPDKLRRMLPSQPYVPSLAYRIAMVANGELDATFVKPNSHDWDLAAADIILREAGGKILDTRGLPIRLGARQTKHGALVAGSGTLLETLAPVIATLKA